MADQAIRPDLIEKLRELARREQRPLNDLVEAMIAKHDPKTDVSHSMYDLAAQETLLWQDRMHLYELARRYWRNTGDAERAALTDEQLDEQFWLFDPDGVPRLKSEQNSIKIPENSLYKLGQAAERVGFRSGQTDISTRSREILENEFADYLLHRRDQSDATE